MGSLKDPKTWIPSITPNKDPKTWIPSITPNKDCSKKVCSIYCTKWCKYVILPSPPPPLPEDHLDGASATLSPVLIVIIALFGSLFVLLAYYIIVSRYCLRNNQSSASLSGQIENQETVDHSVDDYDQEEDNSNYVPWLVQGKGLDETLIKSITLCKYKSGDGLISSTDCSVCLGEFQEDESIRLLPKCIHAFHVYCIDTWLKTHSNCPLCRADVCCEGKSSKSLPLILPPSPPPPPPPPPQPVTSSELERSRDHATTEIREEDGRRKIRRSISMGYLCQNQASISQVLVFDQQTEEMVQQARRFQGDIAGSSENVFEGNQTGLNSVNVSHFDPKGSHSNGMYLFTRDGLF